MALAFASVLQQFPEHVMWGFATAPTVSAWMSPKGEANAPVPAAGTAPPGGTARHGPRPCPARHTALHSAFLRRPGGQRAAAPRLAIGNDQSFEEEEGKTQQIPAGAGAAACFAHVLCWCPVLLLPW